MYKTSSFNLLRYSDLGKPFLINTRTTAIVDVSRKNLEGLVNCLITQTKFSNDQYDERVVRFLLDNGFIVPIDFDEIEWIKRIHRQARQGKAALALAIVLTLNCNFRCTYCYEDHINIDLHDEISESILKFISLNLEGRKRLNIAWFGGEPLLRIKQIHTLSQRVIHLCRENDIQYYGRISTNGYLLTPEVAKLLQSCRVNDVQVTLDGPPEAHDKRRFLANGNPTFNTIYQNLRSVAHMFEKFTVRVNIDNRNIDTIRELLENYLLPLRENIYLSICATMAPACNREDEVWVTPSNQFWKVEKELGVLADELGYKVNRGYQIPCTTFCNAYQNNSFIIDPYGLVHRCTKFIGMNDKSYGRLSTVGNIEIFKDGIQAGWDEWSPFKDEDCLACEVLPLCMGGCLLYLPSDKPKANTHRCFAKHDLINSLLRETIFQDLVDLGHIQRKE